MAYNNIVIINNNNKFNYEKLMNEIVTNDQDVRIRTAYIPKVVLDGGNVIPTRLRYTFLHIFLTLSPSIYRIKKR